MGPILNPASRDEALRQDKSVLYADPAAKIEFSVTIEGDPYGGVYTGYAEIYSSGLTSTHRMGTYFQQVDPPNIQFKRSDGFRLGDAGTRAWGEWIVRPPTIRFMAI